MPAPTVERRDTKQRRLILEIVQHSHAHPSAEEVYQIARRKMRAISLGTVYRNLRLLAEEGKIREVQFNQGSIRFDGMLDHHEHFVCTNCGTVIDIPATSSHKLPALPALEGSVITDYRLDLYGLCKKCNAASSTKQSKNAQ